MAVGVRSGGGVGPPRVTEERKPECWRQRARERSWFVEGIEVRPRRALEAFWRWEQAWARFTRDISCSFSLSLSLVVVVVVGIFLVWEAEAEMVVVVVVKDGELTTWEGWKPRRAKRGF